MLLGDAKDIAQDLEDTRSGNHRGWKTKGGSMGRFGEFL